MLVPGAEDPEIGLWGLAREVEVTGGQGDRQKDMVGMSVGYPWEGRLSYACSPIQNGKPSTHSIPKLINSLFQELLHG